MNWLYELQKQREELAKKLLHAKVLKIPSVGKESARATIKKMHKVVLQVDRKRASLDQGNFLFFKEKKQHMLVTFLWVNCLCYHNYRKSQDRFWVKFNESHFQRTELVSKLFFFPMELLSSSQALTQYARYLLLKQLLVLF